jgi:hypothetical protein
MNIYFSKIIEKKIFIYSLFFIFYMKFRFELCVFVEICKFKSLDEIKINAINFVLMFVITSK